MGGVVRQCFSPWGWGGPLPGRVLGEPIEATFPARPPLGDPSLGRPQRGGLDAAGAHASSHSDVVRLAAGFARARSGALEKQLTLAGVARKRRRALEFHTCFVVAAELREEVAAYARQEVVALE